MQTLTGANDKEKLDVLTGLSHKEQAVWFLNAFWNSVGEPNADQVWGYKHKFDELDQEKAQCPLFPCVSTFSTRSPPAARRGKQFG